MIDGSAADTGGGLSLALIARSEANASARQKQDSPQRRAGAAGNLKRRNPLTDVCPTAQSIVAARAFKSSYGMLPLPPGGNGGDGAGGPPAVVGSCDS